MLPLILVAVGAYLIGDSVLEDSKKYAKGGYMAKGGQLEVGDMVMVDDSGYSKYFSGFDVTKPAKIISKDKKKVFGKVKYFYGLETADGKKPFNNAQESMLTKVSKDGGMMAKGGKLVGKQKNLDVNKNGKLDAEDFKMLRGEKMAKGGEVAFENSNLYLNGFGMDSNGNSVVKVSFPNQRAFSIQTNGVLKETNSLYTKNIGELTETQKKTIEKEVVEYVKQFGSKEQKSKLKTYSGYKA